MTAADHPYRTSILPLAPEVSRPDWSVMIPTFHCARHLRATLESVLAQDPGEDRMQIEVIDDHSTADDPASVVEELGRGRVAFFRQATRRGHTHNFDTCLLRARGRYVHLLHGDDAVLPGFYERMQNAFESDRRIGAAFCRQIFVDSEGVRLGTSPLEQSGSGVLIDGLRRLATEQRIMTPSIAVRREVYEALGGFDHRLVCSEDWEMWVRIAASYPIWYEPEPLAIYRMHAQSNTGRHVRTGEDITYTCRAIDLFSRYLSPGSRRAITSVAKQTYALAALRTARAAMAEGDTETARAHMLAALRCSRSPRVIRRCARLAIRAIRRSLPDKIGRADSSAAVPCAGDER